MNLLMKRVGADVMLPIMVILWGIVCTCQGKPHSARVATLSAHNTI